MHRLVLQGTQTGGVDPAALHLTTVTNVDTTFDTLRLEYVLGRSIFLARVTNVNTFDSLMLSRVTVRNLTATAVSNVNSFDTLQLQLLPFVPVNTELTDLLAQFTGTYSTTAKIQMDTLITELKSAGVWAKFDWYGNAYWAVNEHDALINWKFPTQTLVKVGTPTWTQGVGLTGATPLSNSRYTSGWQVSTGPNASAADVSMFVKITAISAPQNGMQPIGVWRRDTLGGPTAPNGMFFNLNITDNVGFAGANVAGTNGNSSFATGDGLGVWGISHNGSSHITVKDGSTLETDSVSILATYTDPDGMSVAGSAGLTHRSFPGTELYWGWGAGLTAVQFGAIETAFQTSLLPPVILPAGVYLIVDDATGNWLLVGDGSSDYILTEPL